MAVVIVVVVIAALAVAVGAATVARRRRVGPAGERARRGMPPAVPMTGLESALDQVTDRQGRPLRDKIEAGTAIDDLRVPDDSGPILRRALDHVEHVQDDSAHDHVDHGYVDAGDLPPTSDPAAPPGHPPA